MALKLITYDLNKPGQNYKDLHEAIRGLGAWWHYLDSTWIVQSSLSPNAIVEKLKATIDTSDGLLVFDITGDSYSGWLEQGAWDWLNAHA